MRSSACIVGGDPVADGFQRRYTDIVIAFSRPFRRSGAPRSKSWGIQKAANFPSLHSRAPHDKALVGLADKLIGATIFQYFRFFTALPVNYLEIHLTTL